MILPSLCVAIAYTVPPMVAPNPGSNDVSRSPGADDGRFCTAGYIGWFTALRSKLAALRCNAVVNLAPIKRSLAMHGSVKIAVRRKTKLILRIVRLACEK